jgi:hypothetical protein
MKLEFFLAAVVVAASLEVAAPQKSEFSQWMEDASQNVGRLSLGLQDKDAVEATAASKDLQQIFGKIAGYFKEKNSSEAAKYADDAQAGFHRVEELIAAGELNDAYQTMQATRSNCDSCHKEHRERAGDGSYRIKY